MVSNRRRARLKPAPRSQSGRSSSASLGSPTDKVDHVRLPSARASRPQCVPQLGTDGEERIGSAKQEGTRMVAKTIQLSAAILWVHCESQVCREVAFSDSAEKRKPNAAQIDSTTAASNRPHPLLMREILCHLLKISAFHSPIATLIGSWEHRRIAQSNAIIGRNSREENLVRKRPDKLRDAQAIRLGVKVISIRQTVHIAAVKKNAAIMSDVTKAPCASIVGSKTTSVSEMKNGEILIGVMRGETAEEIAGATVDEKAQSSSNNGDHHATLSEHLLRVVPEVIKKVGRGASFMRSLPRRIFRGNEMRPPYQEGQSRPTLRQHPVLGPQAIIVFDPVAVAHRQM